MKRPKWHATPIVMKVFWRIDWFLNTFLFQKRKLSRASAKASYSKSNYDNSKIKAVLNIEFKSVTEYIETIAPIHFIK